MIALDELFVVPAAVELAVLDAEFVVSPAVAAVVVAAAALEDVDSPDGTPPIHELGGGAEFDWATCHGAEVSKRFLMIR
jgi:hypothetical protein